MIAVDHDSIESTRHLAVTHQPMARSEYQAPLLGRGNAGGSAAKRRRSGAAAHLDKNRSISIADYQVDLAALDTKIALDDTQPARFEDGSGTGFTRIAAQLPGSARRHSSGWVEWMVMTGF
jgi:hypothetical protein